MGKAYYVRKIIICRCFGDEVRKYDATSKQTDDAPPTLQPAQSVAAIEVNEKVGFNHICYYIILTTEISPKKFSVTEFFTE